MKDLSGMLVKKSNSVCIRYSRTQIMCSRAWRVERVEGVRRAGARRPETCRSGYSLDKGASVIFDTGSAVI